MANKDFEDLKTRLLKEQKEIAETLAKMPEVPDSGSDVEGEEAEEETDEAEDYFNQISQKQALKTRLVEIKDQLDKLSRG